jgi:hypothetical protein
MTACPGNFRPAEGTPPAWQGNFHPVEVTRQAVVIIIIIILFVIFILSLSF